MMMCFPVVAYYKRLHSRPVCSRERVNAHRPITLLRNAMTGVDVDVSVPRPTDRPTDRNLPLSRTATAAAAAAVAAAAASTEARQLLCSPDHVAVRLSSLLKVKKERKGITLI